MTGQTFDMQRILVRYEISLLREFVKSYSFGNNYQPDNYVHLFMRKSKRTDGSSVCILIQSGSLVLKTFVFWCYKKIHAEMSLVLKLNVLSHLA